MKQQAGKIFIAVIITGMVSVYFAFDLGQYFTLDSIKQKQAFFIEFYSQNKLMTISVFMGIYIMVTALSLPGAAAMTVAAGAMFGLILGVVLVSFASTIGATLAFLASRFVLREIVQNKFGKKLKAVNDGIEKEGAFYLFTLRLVPVVPFFVINLLMGLTPIKVSVFYLVSQLGMLPGTLVFINAGTQLGKLESFNGILSMELIFSFAFIGVFPLISKKVVNIIKTCKVALHLKKSKKR